MKTRDKIKYHTIQLFNEHGFANVTLQNIASNLNISLGNLTYHFPKKDDLVNEIYKTLKQELGELTNPYQANPTFLNIDKQLRVFYQFQLKFKFFYLDTLEITRAYPLIATEHQEVIISQIDVIYEGFYYNIGCGNLTEIYDLNIYKAIAHKSWFILALWRTQVALRGVEDTENEMIEAIWELLMPYFTTKGAEEYRVIRSAYLP